MLIEAIKICSNSIQNTNGNVTSRSAKALGCIWYVNKKTRVDTECVWLEDFKPYITLMNMLMTGVHSQLEN